MTYSEAKGHTGAVIALSMSDAKSDASAEEELLYSAALDNTIRAWQPYDMSNMSCLSTLHETARMLYFRTITHVDSNMRINTHCAHVVRNNVYLCVCEPVVVACAQMHKCMYMHMHVYVCTCM